MVSVCVWRKREVKSVKVTGLEWKIDCSSRIGARPQSAQGLVWSQVSFSALPHQHLAISLFLIWIVTSFSMTLSNIMIVLENAWLSGWSPSLRVQLGSLRIPVPYETSKQNVKMKMVGYVQRQTFVQIDNLFFCKISSRDGSFYKNVCSPFGRFLHLELPLM